MKKTAKQVEGDVYTILKASTLPTTIKGGMLRGENSRPVLQVTEDAVVSFMTGMDGQEQIGVVTVNVYVPHIDNGEVTLKQDAKRCEAIEALLSGIIDEMDADSDEYEFDLQNMIQSFIVEGIDQSRVNAQIHFRRTTL